MNSKSKLGWILLSGASIAAMGAISPAVAQEETTEEVVVTATGRTAALQDVPVAVTAITGDAIENTGANDLRDLTQVAPSFSMGTGQSAATGTTARVRGIGTGSDNPGFEAAVGIFIDGVYRARAGAAMADLPDIERVEILRGPQGTLFGRNTSAGAVSVVTKGPDFEPGMGLEATAAFDDLEEVGTRAMINAPLSDNFAIRLDGSIRARDGYITDLISGDDINNRDRYTARGQALWDISPDASLRVIVDAAGTDEVCCGITPLIYGSTQLAIQGAFVAIGQPGNAVASTPAIDPEGRGMTVTPGRDYLERTDEIGASAQFDWDIGGMNFTSITAYRDWEALRNQDIDFNLIDIAYRDGLEVEFKNFTQELRLQGENGRINWLVGAFYGDEDMRYDDTIRIGGQSSLYTNVATLGNTASLFPGGCELYDFTAQPSIFQCAALGPPLNAFNPGLFNHVNSINFPADAGHLRPNPDGSGQSLDHWTVETESWSLFTHDEFSFTDQLVLTVGARYNSDNKDLSANLNSVSPSCLDLQAMETATDPDIPGPGGIVSALQGGAASSLMNFACNPAINPIANGTWTGSADEQEWSGTASLAYHISPDLMVYGGYSRGYKAGGFNVDRSGFSVTPATTSVLALNTDQLHFDPEFTDAYEIGLRSTVLGGTTTLNLTAYYQQIHDYQLNAFNGFNFITRNIPEAISQGAELEITSHLTDNLTLTAGVTYNDAYYDSEVRFNPLTACTNGVLVGGVLAGVSCASPSSIGPNPDDPNAVFSGSPFAFAPEWAATGSITYDMPITGDIHALFYLDGRWNDEYRTQTLARDPQGRTDNGAFAIFNGRIGIGPADQRWSVEIWGRNLADEFYYIGAFQTPLQNTYVIYPSEPQTYGVTLRARY